MSNLLPDYTPIYPVTKAVKPRQRTAKLPSWGIEQRDGKGQNQTSPEWSVRWILAPNEANTLDTFLSEQAKTGEWFLWTPPNAAQGRFRCDDWSKQLSSCNIYEVQATFRQVFGFARPLLSSAFIGYFTLTGRNVGLSRSYIFRPIKRDFALSGNDATWVRTRRMLADTGVFVLTCNDVPSIQTYQLLVDTGTFALTGNAAVLARIRQVLANTGIFVLTGNDAALTIEQQQLAAETGVFVLTGAAVSFSLGGGSSPPGTTGEASFWSDWAATSSDIFLYEEGAVGIASEASFWSDWASMSSDTFLYEEGTTASESPAYWNRWQSWAEDPPLLFEQST